MPASATEQLNAIQNAGETQPSGLGSKLMYILYYRQGSNPHPQFLFFFHSSTDMKVISERAKRHCDTMSYRFVYVRPAIVDLDKAENFLTQRD